MTKIQNTMHKVFSCVLALLCITSVFDLVILSSAAYYDKLSIELQDKLQSTSDSSAISVMIVGNIDDSSNNNMTSGIFSRTSLINTNLYTLNSNLSDVSIDTIQNNITKKRQQTANFYKEYNTLLSEKLNISEKIIYSSSYAPILFADLSKDDIISISRKNDVSAIAHCNKNIEYDTYLDISKATTNADSVQTNLTFFGYTGDGVKIGILEKLHPYIYAEWLDDANITLSSYDSTYMDSSYGGHATTVTSIMASQGSANTVTGTAPDAEYFCASLLAIADEMKKTNVEPSVSAVFIEAIEWLVEKGVNIINISVGLAGIYNSYATTAYTDSYYLTYTLDKIALNSDVTFVLAAGNTAKQGIPYPLMGYNAISVGNTDDKNTSVFTDDSLNTSSSYCNILTPTYASKPDICAPGTLINLNGSDNTYMGSNLTYEGIKKYAKTSGTSVSAPHVAGCIALLYEQKPLLLYSPDAAKAIITAGVFTSNHCYVPSDRIVTIDENNPASSYIQYGAGIINCVANGNIVKNESYDFGYFTPQFTLSNDQLQLTGQKNVRISLAYALNTDNYNMTLDNFDIYLYNSTGTLIGSSTTTYNNVEIIDAYIPTTGTYTLKIVRTSSTNRTIPMGIAWIQYS